MNLGLLVASENADKVYPGFLTLDHMGKNLSKKINNNNKASQAVSVVDEGIHVGNRDFFVHLVLNRRCKV